MSERNRDTDTKTCEPNRRTKLHKHARRASQRRATKDEQQTCRLSSSWVKGFRDNSSNMRSWLLVLTVLATFHTFSRVAGSQEVRIPPARPDSYSIFLDSTTTTKTTESANAESSSSQVVNKLRSSDISSVKESVENEISNEVTDDREEYEEVTVRRKPNAEQLVEIEKNLLSMFGFKKRPQIDRSKVVIPEAMRRLYEQIMGHELDTPKSGLHTKNANTVRSFTHEETDIDRRFQHHHRFRLHFNVSSIPQGDELRAAELVLSRKAHLEGEKLRHHVLVYDIVRPGIKGRRDPLMTLVDAKSVKISENGTITLDVMPAVARWLKVPRHNHGLLIHVSSMDANLTSVPEHRHIRLRRSVEDSATTEGETEGWQQQQPLLMTYTDDGRHKPRPARDANSGMPPRSRRAPGRKGKRPLRICQRHPLYVDFSDVGWSDWIVAPPGYDAHYCAGECTFPIADHLNTTNHAIVQTLVNSINPNTVPKACCVPTHLSSICMLYLDDQNKVVLKNYQDMTVIGCGCR